MKTIHIMVEKSVGLKESTPVYKALADILERLDIREFFDFHDLGDWQDQDYKIDGILSPFKSVEWFIDFSYKSRTIKTSPNLNTADLLTNLITYKCTHAIDFVVFMTNQTIIHPEKGLMLGATSKYNCSIISLNHFDFNKTETSQEVYNLAMHEFGHLLGLVLDTSRPNLKHCSTPRCIMSPYNPSNYLGGFEGFCKECRAELEQYANYVASAGRVKVLSESP